MGFRQISEVLADMLADLEKVRRDGTRGAALDASPIAAEVGKAAPAAMETEKKRTDAVETPVQLEVWRNLKPTPPKRRILQCVVSNSRCEPTHPQSKVRPRLGVGSHLVLVGGPDHAVLLGPAYEPPTAVIMRRQEA